MPGTLNEEAIKYSTWPTGRFQLHQTSVNTLYEDETVVSLAGILHKRCTCMMLIFNASFAVHKQCYSK